MSVQKENNDVTDTHPPDFLMEKGIQQIDIKPRVLRDALNL